MPNYLLMLVSDVPAVGQSVTGQLRVETAPDLATAEQQALQALGPVRPGVIGGVLASQVTRNTFTPPSGQYTVT